ncbi:MAG: 6-carboxytetrahydropterin synthase QueD [Chloroflexi bacterium]|nr:6-carboxytetrahydropterin synthase QueD [Chloroflexota bacterium]
MYQVSIQDHFDAAHYLRDYGGRCENLHGHRFVVAVTLEAPGLNEIGLVYDFTALKGHVKEILSRFDHTCLNDMPSFQGRNPSSENIAATVYEELAARLVGAPAVLRQVQVWESPEAWATYIPEG